MIGKSRKKTMKSCVLAAMAVLLVTIAIAFLWWYGFFLPGWIPWQKESGSLEGKQVILKNRKVIVYKDGSCEQRLWETQDDWFVQDMLIKDLDRDGREELILLLWKHGSYGEHMPFWVEKNDKQLKQHLFLYKQDDTRKNGIRPMWMSSEISYEIESISSGKGERLKVTTHDGIVKEWIWKDFGLTYVGENVK